MISLPKHLVSGHGRFFVARRSVTVGPGDVRQIGDEVPEAFGWKKARALVSIGTLVYVPTKPDVPRKRK